jgi:hypothetical protein
MIIGLCRTTISSRLLAQRRGPVGRGEPGGAARAFGISFLSDGAIAGKPSGRASAWKLSAIRCACHSMMVRSVAGVLISL